MIQSRLLQSLHKQDTLQTAIQDFTLSLLRFNRSIYTDLASQVLGFESKLPRERTRKVNDTLRKNSVSFSWRNLQRKIK